MNTTFMGVLFVELERSITHLRPTPRVVAMTMWSTNFINTMNRLVGHFNHHVEELHLVKHAEWSALLGCSVIGKQYDHGVVIETEFFNRSQQAPYLNVRVIKEGRISLLQAAREALLIR